MADYTSTFTEADGVDDVEAADFSTEFDAIQTAIATKYDSDDLLDEDDMASNSDTKFPSQQSVKAYVDNSVELNVLGTEQNLSGTSVSFTGIPTGVKRIAITLESASLSSSGWMNVQIGDAGGLETSGYVGGTAFVATASQGYSANSAEFKISTHASGTCVISGTVTLTLKDATNNTWTISGDVADSGESRMNSCGGVKSLSATLDRVAITATGASTFDAGSVNILYT